MSPIEALGYTRQGVAAVAAGDESEPRSQCAGRSGPRYGSIWVPEKSALVGWGMCWP